MNWLKQNMLSITNLLLLIYLLFQLASIKSEMSVLHIIATKTALETELNNSKLDYVESDINSKLVDSIISSAKK